MRIIAKLHHGRRRRLKRSLRRERNAVVKTRPLVVLRLNEGASSGAIEHSGVCALDGAS